MDNYHFDNVAALSRHLGLPVLVYDLEATTFRGRPNFGITEVACATVSPTGTAALFGELINPERRIDPNVVALNGITQAMVSDKETWGKKYARLFVKLASGDAWVTGFNNSTFDNHAVVDMNERYGHPVEKFTRTFDVRRLHKKLTASTSQAGTLQEISAMYGVSPRGSLHRAMADTVLTLELLDAVVKAFGVEAVAAVVLDKARKGSKSLEGRTLTPEALVLLSRKHKRLTLQQVAEAFGKEHRAVSFEVGRAIDERVVCADVFACEEQQEWLAHSLLELDTDLLTQGKLKPLHAAVNERFPAGEVDYVQLRIALLRAGLGWSSLKPA